MPHDQLKIGVTFIQPQIQFNTKLKNYVDFQVTEMKTTPKHH